MVSGLALLHTNPKMAGGKTNLQRTKPGHFHLGQHRDTDPSVLGIKDTESGELDLLLLLLSFIVWKIFGSLKKGYCGSKLLVGFLSDWV